MRLASDELSQRAQILQESISVEGVFEAEVAEIDKRKTQENIAEEAMEKKRAEEKEKGRSEIITGQLNEKNTQDSEAFPICTRTPRMLITGKRVVYQKSAFCANNLKCLHQQRSGMS